MTSSPESDRRILIVARSARGLTEAAAAAGYLPWAIDAFADTDTRTLAAGFLQVPVDGVLRFVPEALLDAVEQVQGVHGPMPIVTGAGFEHAPQLLDALARRGPLAGGNAHVLRALLDVPSLFERIGRLPAIAFAPTRADRPQDDGAWLVKTAGACGGHHVRAWRPTCVIGPHDYFQRHVAGTCMSALFLAGGGRVLSCGQAVQLRWHPHPDAPFRYEGACSLPALPPAFARAVRACAAAIATELGIRGCFGIDFIRTPDDVPVVLDINPRPTASLDLRSDKGRIFTEHVRACTAGELLYSRLRTASAAGHLVLYADRGWTVPANFQWPAAAVDRCAGGARVEAGMPLCTLRVKGATPEEVTRELARAANALGGVIEKYVPGVLPRITRVIRVGETADVQART